MQKGCQKGSSPQPPADPLEGSLLRREQYRKRTNKQKNNKLLQNANVGCRKVRCSARWSAKSEGAVQEKGSGLEKSRVLQKQGPPAS